MRGRKARRKHLGHSLALFLYYRKKLGESLLSTLLWLHPVFEGGGDSSHNVSSSLLSFQDSGMCITHVVALGNTDAHGITDAHAQ